MANDCGHDLKAIAEQTKDLKNSHFNLGSDKPKNTTEAGQAFNNSGGN